MVPRNSDAVRQNIEHFLDIPADYFLILSGDQLYRMDFKKMLRFAKATDADVVIAAFPITESNAKRMGVLKANDQKWITEFLEKPQDPALFTQFLYSQPKTKRGKKEPSYLGSMGIYLFKKEVLFELLKQDDRHDFGKHLIPTLVSQGRAAAFIHDDYWEDIGTIHSFYQANLALTEKNPPFDIYNPASPIYTTFHHLPAPKINNTAVKQAIICEGSIIDAKEITRSIIGPRSQIKKGTIIRDSYLMGSDHYEQSIGENCLIMNAILDKRATLGNRVQLVNKNQLTHYDGGNIFIRDGIIVVPKGATLPDDFIL